MSRKIKAFDWRSKHICFVCEKELKKQHKNFMVALDGYHIPINLYIHRKCYDETKIKARLKEINTDDWR